eukprot:TRINITY_DN8128_c0_g1_i1.p1 TRINITY_DN8128_c0_g1~~TRINITY_DN8128_c0_g1_i1.p1  ORF type:complete len:773 (-),score=192.79 TRINITY_DN8128_c0_g1_i1:20-2065(-)
MTPVKGIFDVSKDLLDDLGVQCRELGASDPEDCVWKKIIDKAFAEDPGLLHSSLLNNFGENISNSTMHCKSHEEAVGSDNKVYHFVSLSKNRSMVANDTEKKCEDLFDAMLNEISANNCPNNVTTFKHFADTKTDTPILTAGLRYVQNRNLNAELVNPFTYMMDVEKAKVQEFACLHKAHPYMLTTIQDSPNEFGFIIYTPPYEQWTNWTEYRYNITEYFNEQENRVYSLTLKYRTGELVVTAMTFTEAEYLDLNEEPDESEPPQPPSVATTAATLITHIDISAELSNNGSDCITTMTYNVLNFDSGKHWEVRKGLIANEIALAKPDVITFQEIRINHHTNASMLRDIAALLPTYQFVYAMGMFYADLGVEEGTATFTTLPLRRHEIHVMPQFPDDSNRRILLHVSLDSPVGPLDVFNAHWSYGKSSQKIQALETLRVANKYKNTKQIVMGDLNIFPNLTTSVDVLTGTPIPDFRTVGDFTDAWYLLHPESDVSPAGMTYNTNPSLLKTRCDRVLFRGGNFNVTNIEKRGGKANALNIFPSDHFALVTTFCSEPTTEPPAKITTESPVTTNQPLTTSPTPLTTSPTVNYETKPTTESPVWQLDGNESASSGLIGSTSSGSINNSAPLEHQHEATKPNFGSDDFIDIETLQVAASAGFVGIASAVIGWLFYKRRKRLMQALR